MGSEALVVYRRAVDDIKGEDSLRFAYKELNSQEAAKAADLRLTDGNKDWVEVDSAYVEDLIKVEQYNRMSWLGKPVHIPWRTVKWYGLQIYFTGPAEFMEFTRFRWLARASDTCPVCANYLKRQLRYTFAEGSGLPFQVFFCSRACQQHFMRNYSQYRELLSRVKDSK